MSEEIIKTPENGAEPVRTIEVITAEIVTIKRQAQQIALYIAIELGRRLTVADDLHALLAPVAEWWDANRAEMEYLAQLLDHTEEQT